MSDHRFNCEAFRVSIGGIVSAPYVERGVETTGILVNGRLRRFLDPQIGHGPNSCAPAEMENLVLGIDESDPPALEKRLVHDFAMDGMALLSAYREGKTYFDPLSVYRPTERPIARMALVGVLDHSPIAYANGDADILRRGERSIAVKEHRIGKSAAEGSGVSILLVEENEMIVVQHTPMLGQNVPTHTYDLTYRPDSKEGIVVNLHEPETGELPGPPSDEGGDGGSDRSKVVPLRPRGQSGAEVEWPEEDVVVTAYPPRMM